jgi:inner membrane protein
MDNLTHSLVGLMLARAAGSERDKYLPSTLVIAANIPDMDVVAGLGGALDYLQYHRSYTHALVFAPVMALLPPLILWAAVRARMSLRVYLLSLLGVLSHLALDWTNAYGIRLFLPFSSRWLRLDMTDIVDPWILVVLLLAVAAPALSRLVSAEIGARSGPGPQRGWAWFALLVVLAYEGSRFAAHDRALGVMGARLFNGAIPQRLTALPDRFSPFRWRGIAECEQFVSIVPVDLNRAFDPSAGPIFYPAGSSPAIDAARRTRPFQVFGQFSQLQFWKVTPLPEASRVELIDLRFGSPARPGFEAEAVIDASGNVRETRFGFGPLPVNTRN